MSSVPSSAHASSQGKCFGSEKGRGDDAHVVVMVWAIMQPPLEFLIETGIRASIVLRDSECGNLYWI